jgi:hypothetical protein
VTGVGWGLGSCARRRADIAKIKTEVATRGIMGELNSKRWQIQLYQSAMKLVFASLFLTFFAVPFATAKDRYCMFRVHAEANRNDTIVFATSVRAKFSGKEIAIEKTPRLTERDVEAFYPYPKTNGSYGALLQLDEHGRLVLDTLSIERRGSLLFVFINGQPITEVQIDQRVSDGRIYVAKGLSAADIESMKKDWRLIGHKKR